MERVFIHGQESITSNGPLTRWDLLSEFYGIVSETGSDSGGISSRDGSESDTDSGL